MILALLAAVALGAPAVRLVATVDADLRTVRGELRAEDLDDATWVDPLADLPVPADGLEEARTFPVRANAGTVRFHAHGDRVVFEAVLPRRWGDLGATAHGLFANGGWYPQPLVDGRLPEVRWEVQVQLPDDTTGALGDAAGRGLLSWTGTADRASLAVVPGGQVTRVQGEGVDVRLITRRRPRLGLRRHLPDQLALATFEGRRWTGVVVESPLRRRLVRPGAGLAYLSDRAWRVFPGFARLHHDPVVRGLLTAWSGQAGALEREVVGAALGRVHETRLRRRLQVDLLGLTKWIPLVDTAIYNREMAFKAELFDRVLPSDPVADDLAERFAPHAPGTLVVAQLGDTLGRPAVETLGRRLAAGWTLDAALAAAGVPEDGVARWRQAYPEQDYVVRLEGSTAHLRRDAPDDAPAETLVVDVDGRRRTWAVPVGPAETTLALDAPPRRLALDPERHTGQASRAGDVRPAPLRWTLWGQLSGINVAQGFASAFVQLTARGAADTHNATALLLWTDQRARLGTSLRWTRYAGRLIQPTVREHALTLGLDTAWLNPTFPGTDLAAPLSVGGTASYRWDSRTGLFFPRRGGRLRLTVSAGGTPGSGQTYVRVLTHATTEIPAGTRVVFAGRLATGLAATDIPQERLAFGGDEGVRGLPDRAVQTGTQTVASLEVRGVPLSQGSVPLGLGWLRDVQLLAGVDVGIGSTEGRTVAAAGAVGGVGFVADLFGLTPASATVVVGVPLWTRGIALDPYAWPVELYIVWGMMF
ncbi:MAG: hypothetical protein H6732_17615 [Alphaproteobacteria bacterium]|nr:hypothetical protein [Alphaproteobacteria bacterium]